MFARACVWSLLLLAGHVGTAAGADPALLAALDQLGADDLAVRQRGRATMLAAGPAAVPVLVHHLDEVTIHIRLRVAALIERLGAPRWADREAATRALRAIGSAAMEALDAARTSKNPEVAWRASLVHGRIQTSDRQAAARRTRRHTAVLELLSQLADGRAVAALVRELDGEHGDRVRLALVGLGRAGDAVPAAPLIRLLTHAEWSIRALSVWTLGEVPGDDAHAALARVAGDLAQSPYLRARAIGALTTGLSTQTPAPRRATLAGLLAGLLDDADWEVRASAIAGLRRLAGDTRHGFAYHAPASERTAATTAWRRWAAKQAPR